jgi:benzylsuccinate CoA-transferase BbsF subunit
MGGTARHAALAARLADQDALDAEVASWTRGQNKFDLQRRLRAAGVPCAAVQKPEERVEHDPDTARIWPAVTHPQMGEVRVDGLAGRFSATPWRIERSAPLLGQHNEEVFGRLLGLSSAEVAQLREEGVI